MAVIFWRDNTVFFVQLTNPPVNAINLQTRRELIKSNKNRRKRETIDRIILFGDKKIFLLVEC